MENKEWLSTLPVKVLAKLQAFTDDMSFSNIYSLWEDCVKIPGIGPSLNMQWTNVMEDLDDRELLKSEYMEYTGIALPDYLMCSEALDAVVEARKVATGELSTLRYDMLMKHLKTNPDIHRDVKQTVSNFHTYSTIFRVAQHWNISVAKVLEVASRTYVLCGFHGNWWCILPDDVQESLKKVSARFPSIVTLWDMCNGYMEPVNPGMVEAASSLDMWFLLSCTYKGIYPEKDTDGMSEYELRVELVKYGIDSQLELMNLTELITYRKYAEEARHA